MVHNRLSKVVFFVVLVTSAVNCSDLKQNDDCQGETGCSRDKRYLVYPTNAAMGVMFF